MLEERARGAGLRLAEWVREALLSAPVELGPDSGEVALAEVRLAPEPYNQMQMQLASDAHIPDGLLAAITLLNEKPRLGVPSCNPASLPGQNVCQSTAALGLSWSVVSETRQSEVMGRFLSPDPLGPWVADASDPQSWNMYAYARNNPLTNTDPTGYDCVYLNDAGTGIDKGGVDTNSNSGECGNNGGYWVDGTFTSGTVYANNNDVYLHGFDSSTGQLTDAYSNVVTANGNSSSINTRFQLAQSVCIQSFAVSAIWILERPRSLAQSFRAIR